MGNILAVDLGGTWMRAAIVDGDGHCRDVVRRPTHSRRPADEILSDLLALLVEARPPAGSAEQDVELFSVGVPTVLDSNGGLQACDNLPTMGGLPIGRDLQRRLDRPVQIHNDAACFAVGEQWRGVGRGCRCFVGITLGTGIGLATVLEGRLHRGSHGLAGEIWKSPLAEGKVEDLTCGGSIERLYEAAAGRRLSGPEVAALARASNDAAVGAFAQFGQHLGRAVAFVVNLLDPDAVALGGSVSDAFDLFSPSLRQTVLNGTVAGAAVRLERSSLGERAALIGAARLAGGPAIYT